MRSQCSCGEFPISPSEIPPRVLVIDNEPLVQWSLTAGLRAAGFDAVPAGDVTEARALARQFPRPEVVLLDARLWNTDPRQLLEEIRGISPHCRFLVLAMAGHDVTLPPWDNVAVVRKPFDLHEVVRLVRAALPCRGQGHRLAIQRGSTP